MHIMIAVALFIIVPYIDSKLPPPKEQVFMGVKDGRPVKVIIKMEKLTKEERAERLQMAMEVR